jgi:hypothetical protein
MPIPSAFGTAFSARDAGFSSTYAAGNIDVGTAGVYVHGWVTTTGFSTGTNADPSTGRPGAVTIGGVALTMSAPQDRNTVFGAGSGGWVAEVYGFVPGKTGLQAVVATQVTAGGAPATTGRVFVELQVFNDVVSVPVKTDIGSTSAAGGGVSTSFASATDRLDVLSAHTSMSPVNATPMTASAVAPSALRSAAQPPVSAAVFADRPSAASTSLTVNTTGSFSFSFIGTRLSLDGGTGTAPQITTQPQAVTVTAGQSATFTVAANGTAPLAYQWTRGGVDIAGATGNSYTIASTVLGDNGAQIGVRVTNAVGTAASAAATLTVTSSSYSAAFPQGVAVDFAGAAKRTSQAWTGYVIPFNAALPAGAATAPRTPISGTTAADGALTIAGIPFAGAMQARVYFGAGSTLALYTLTGTAA